MSETAHGVPPAVSFGEEDPPLSEEAAWNQLGNVVALVAKQDQIVWAVFGVFWAANAVLLVALFPSGGIPMRPVGIIVSTVGFVLSMVWFAIEQRALAWLTYYEDLIAQLEQKRLKLPTSVSITCGPKVVKGSSVRPLIQKCAGTSAALWAFAVLWFLVRGQ